jgi:HemY protein
LVRIQSLAEKAPGNVEAALAVARAAIEAQEFEIARRALSPLTIVPTRRIAALMAQLEQSQHGDEGRAREWMVRALNARRDPAWTTDGFVSDRWLPVSPVTGKLDAFAWKDPLAGEEPAGPVIEAAEASAPVEVGKTLERESEGAEQASPPLPAQAHRASASARFDALSAEIETDHGATAHAGSTSGDESTRRSSPQIVKRLMPIPLAPAVIPLVHAPDDPGPEPEGESDPSPEPDEEGAPEGWSRIRHLFRQ